MTSKEFGNLLLIKPTPTTAWGLGLPPTSRSTVLWP